MKKYFATILAVLMLVPFAACGETDTQQPTEMAAGAIAPAEAVTEITTITEAEADASAEEEPIVTPSIVIVSEPTIEQHEDIVPVTYEEDEVVANLYYKRSADNEGNFVFEVIRESDGETVLLPVNQTILYISEADEHYYEMEVLSYEIDGEEVTTVQYALHVQGINP